MSAVPSRRIPRLVAALALLAAAPAAAQTLNGDPEKVQLVTSDIPRFWQAYDGATLVNAAERFQRMYIDPGSPGVQGFVPGRIGSGRALAATVAARPRFYAAIRAATLAVDTASSVKARIRAGLRQFKALYPEARFPDVYFVIGRINSGGTAGDAGLYIGTEMFALGPDTPLDELGAWERAVVTTREVLPHIVLHELVHFQQPPDSTARTLLARALREGTADFVGQLASGGTFNTAQQAYGDAHEAALWAEFREAMRGTDVSRWMYQGEKATDRPADLGYYVGSRIAKAYYDRAADKRAALRDLLTTTDAEAILRASGYEELMARKAGR